MKLSDVINEQWLNPTNLKSGYLSASPFPHIVMHDFIKPELLKKVADEFPDLSKLDDAIIKYFNNSREIKLASKGMSGLSSQALHLNSYLQSDLFLDWLNILTSIEEPLISDPYLSGGGYHEIKQGGLLKVHADFNKHPKLALDRRLNLLIYLNENWEDDWGGALQLFDKDMNQPQQTIYPRFNTALIFTTTSYTYHGHPDPLGCPSHRSRRSLAYYYFSLGRPDDEVSEEKHSTLFKERKGEKFESNTILKKIVRELTPPILIKVAKRVLGRKT